MHNFPIVDAHVHLWNPQTFPIPWLAEVPAINRPFGLTDYHAQTADLPLVGMVYVEVDVAPQFGLLEAEHVVGLAARDPQLQGIVATAPVDYGEQARVYLDALRKLGPLIKGVRRNLQGEADPDACLQTKFILDHLGKPNIRAHVLDPWRADLERLAASPNVWCKVSGLLTEADAQQWQLADLVPYVAHALAVFGEQRVLFGGDWPVMLQAGSYQQWVEAMTQLTAHLPEAAQRAFWGENARGCYRLGG